ncbi:MAG TPA: hypothetical protein VNT75_24655, partial [Symbiobacteriaceae bacterium]|nr:hypothetical protein [Symbiobacteriaceae bacterium]
YWSVLLLLALTLSGCSSFARLSDGRRFERTINEIRQTQGGTVLSAGPFDSPAGSFGLFYMRRGQDCYTGLVDLRNGGASVSSGGGSCGSGGFTASSFGGQTLVVGREDGATAVTLDLGDGTELKATLFEGFWYLLLPTADPEPYLAGADIHVTR